MSIQRLAMEVMYRIGFTPWDGHAQPVKLKDLVEGPHALPAGRALDVGCGTGDSAIYVAQHGWDVTGLDFTGVAIQRAQKKAAAAGQTVRFIHGDATKLRTYGLGSGFQLVIDNGCMHGMSKAQRDAYVTEVTAVTSPGGYLVLAAFVEGNSSGPAGINPPEIERRFGPDWELLSAAEDPSVSATKDMITVYVLRRR